MRFLPNGKYWAKAFRNFVIWIDSLNTYFNLGV